MNQPVISEVAELKRQVLRFQDSCMFALGYLWAKGEEHSDAALWLAKALKESGFENAYVDTILERRKTS